MLQKKSLTELNALLAKLSLTDQCCSAFRLLSSLNGGEDTIAKARQLLLPDYPEMAPVLDDLELIATAISQRFPAVSLYFDLGELRGYNYHTGVVFAVYIPSYGQPLAKGGRYDEIGKVFGRARPATGFSGDLKVLAELAADHARSGRSILAPVGVDTPLQAKIAELRQQGERVVQALPAAKTILTEMNCDRELILRDGDWCVVAVDSSDFES